MLLPLLVFCLSGFAALLYQVIWQRLLVIFSGADVFSITVIVAAFMAGLGVGSLAGGYLADRLGPRRNLYAFACAELAIGLFGLISKPLYYDVLYQRYPHLAASHTVAALVLFATLLLPTFMMGVSLPLLARALADTLRTTPRVIGLLYGCNTLRAAAGAMSAPWILIPRFGLEQSLWIAAATNGLCALLAVYIATDAPPIARQHAPTTTVTPAVDDVVPDGAMLSFRAWVLLYGLTGFIALGLELAWFRLLGVLLKSTAFTFGTLLGVYLAGLGAGAIVGARTVARSRHPGATFLALQYAVTMYAALSVTALVMAVAAGRPARLVRFLGSYEPVNVYETLARIGERGVFSGDGLSILGDFLFLYLAVPIVLIGPPTFLLGLSFPYLQKASQADVGHVGRRLGALMASNIAGAVAGAIMTGWWMLATLGTAGTLKVLIALGGIIAWPLARVVWPERGRRQISVTVSAAAITAGAVMATPAGDMLWARLHGTTPRQMLFDEDGAGLSVLKFERAAASGAIEVYVNGLGQSWLPYGNIHTALGALPAFIHPAPADVAIIGFGSGDTAFAAAGRQEIQRLVSIEILGAQRRSLERLLQLQRYPGLLAVLSDRRIDHRVGDGRAFLSQTADLFDIIEADALRPSSAYSGNLYSREYFMLVAKHLKPGGYGVTWAPSPRIRATFRNVFPHVLALGGDIYIGSNAPIPFDRNAVLARIAAVNHYYASANVDMSVVLRQYLGAPHQRFWHGDHRPVDSLNTDLFPRDEFALPF